MTDREQQIFAAIDELRALKARITDEKKCFKQAVHKAGLNLTLIQQAVKAIEAGDSDWFFEQHKTLEQVENVVGRYMNRAALQQPTSDRGVAAMQQSFPSVVDPPSADVAPSSAGARSELGAFSPANGDGGQSSTLADDLENPGFLKRAPAATAAASRSPVPVFARYGNGASRT